MKSVVSLSIVLLLGITIIGLFAFGEFGAIHKLMTATIAITSHLTVVLIGLLIVLVSPRPTWSGRQKVAAVLFGTIITTALSVGLATEWGFITTSIPVAAYTPHALAALLVIDVVALLINIT